MSLTCPLLDKRCLGFCSIRWDPNPGQSLWKRRGLCIATICEDLTCPIDVQSLCLLFVSSLVPRRRGWDSPVLRGDANWPCRWVQQRTREFPFFTDPSVLRKSSRARAALAVQPSFPMEIARCKQWCSGREAAQSLVSQPVPTLACNDLPVTGMAQSTL